jgi:hypothetical protein
MFSKSILALAALVGAVVAQSSSSNITIDPNTVDAQLRGKLPSLLTTAHELTASI